MFKKIKSLFKKQPDEWYADYKMEDGQTGRVFSTFEIDIVESIALKRNHKSIWFSVNGGEWFDSFAWGEEGD